jgi:hypothetical protein
MAINERRHQGTGHGSQFDHYEAEWLVRPSRVSRPAPVRVVDIAKSA